MSKTILISIICAAALWAKANPLVGEWHHGESFKMTFTEDGYVYENENGLMDTSKYEFKAPDSLYIEDDDMTLHVEVSEKKLVVDGSFVLQAGSPVGLSSEELLGSWASEVTTEGQYGLDFLSSDSVVMFMRASYEIVEGKLKTAEQEMALEMWGDSLSLAEPYGEDKILFSRAEATGKSRKRSKKIKSSAFSKNIVGEWHGMIENEPARFTFSKEGKLLMESSYNYTLKGSLLAFNNSDVEGELVVVGDSLNFLGQTLIRE